MAAAWSVVNVLLPVAQRTALRTVVGVNTLPTAPAQVEPGANSGARLLFNVAAGVVESITADKSAEMVSSECDHV